MTLQSQSNCNSKVAIVIAKELHFYSISFQRGICHHNTSASNEIHVDTSYGRTVTGGDVPKQAFLSMTLQSQSHCNSKVATVMAKELHFHSIFFERSMCHHSTSDSNEIHVDASVGSTWPHLPGPPL